jgi:hypothetical protein
MAATCHWLAPKNDTFKAVVNPREEAPGTNKHQYPQPYRSGPPPPKIGLQFPEGRNLEYPCIFNPKYNMSAPNTPPDLTASGSPATIIEFLYYAVNRYACGHGRCFGPNCWCIASCSTEGFMNQRIFALYVPQPVFA